MDTLRILLPLLLLATPLLAQQPERLVYTMLVAEDTVALERVERSPHRLGGQLFLVPQRLRVEYEAILLPDGRVATLASSVFRVDADESPLQQARFEFTGDSVLLQSGGSTQWFGTRAGTIPYLNLSAAFLEQAVIVARAQREPRAEVPVFTTAGGQTLPMQVTFTSPDSARVEFAGVSFDLRVTAEGRILEGAVPAQRLTVTRTEGDREFRIAPRDYSAPAGAPYTAEEVVVRTPAGLRLTGTLTLPATRPAGGAPAIITISGSGPQDRDSAIPGVSGYRPFRQIADTLARRGIATLRLDDRGVGGSDRGPDAVTSADLADDIRAAMAWLRARSDVDGDRIALVGHSEGGIIAPMIAATDSRLRGIVLMAGTASPGREILRYQQEFVVDSVARLRGTARDSALAAFRQNTDSAARATPWLAFFVTYEPTATARRVRTPVLILQGATDRQVPEREAHALAAAFRQGGNQDVSLRIYPELNHLFLHDPSGSFAGYAQLKSRTVPAPVLGDLADWLAERLR